MSKLTSEAFRTARKQRVTIEYTDGDGYMVLFANGDVSTFGTPELAIKAIQKRAGRGNKGVTMTTIEWRNTPEGFVPPALVIE